VAGASQGARVLAPFCPPRRQRQGVRPSDKLPGNVAQTQPGIPGRRRDDRRRSATLPDARL